MSVSYGGDKITFDDNSSIGTGWGSLGKNLLINGSMQVDQRRAGNSTTPGGDVFLTDRWYFSSSQTSKFTMGQNLGGVTGPGQFRFCLGVQTASAFTPSGSDRAYIVYNGVEGYDATNLEWGTASARTVTLSFWTRSSITGTFGGVVRMAGVVSYPFSYTINAQNTWEYKTITVPGYTVSASWNSTTNGSAVSVRFNLGSQNNSDFAKPAGAWIVDADTATGTTSIASTANATWYITGVQLEKGSYATSFEHVPFNVEFLRCMRYYEKSFNYGTVPANGSTTTSLLTTAGAIQTVDWLASFTSGTINGHVRYKVPKRASPNMTIFGTSAGKILLYDFGTKAVRYPAGVVGGTYENGFNLYNDGTDGQTNNTTWGLNLFHYIADAEM